MKNVMIILAVTFMGLSTTLSAQTQPRSPRAVNLDEIPEITTAQKDKIEKIRTNHQAEMQKLMAENRGKRGQMTETELTAERNRRLELMKQRDAEVESVLTAEQYAFYKDRQGQMRQEMRPRQGKGNRSPGHHAGRGRRNAVRPACQNPASCPCLTPAPASVEAAG